MSTPAEQTEAVSDPQSERYDPNSPYYDVTADSSSPFYVGKINEEAASGDEVRDAATGITNMFPLSLFDGKARDSLIQSIYTGAISDARDGLDEGLEMRTPGEPPRTIWDNASHEQMIDALNNNADSAAVAETSEEWVQMGNELTLHQKAVADAINDSMGDWQGEGGHGARQHLAEVAKWLGATAQGAVLTGRQQQIHSQTLNESQKQMADNPPVQFSLPEANARLTQITDPAQYAAEAQQAIQKMQEQQAARGQAARIMTQFDDTVGSATQLPLFSPPPKLAAARTTAHLRGADGGGAGSGGTARLDAIRTEAPGSGSGSGSSPGSSGTLAESGAGTGAGIGIGPGLPGTGPGSANSQYQAPDVATPDMPNGPEGLSSPGGYNPPGGLNPPDGDTPYSPSPVPAADMPNTSGGPNTPGGVNPPGGGTPAGGYNPPGGGTTYSPPPIPEPNMPQTHGGGAGGGGDYTPARVNVPDFDDATSASSYTSPNIPTADMPPGGGKAALPPGWSGGVNGDINSRLSGGGPGAFSPGGSFGGAMPTGGAGRGGGAAGASATRGGTSTGAGAGAVGPEGTTRPGQVAPGPGGRAGTAGGMAPGMGGMGAGKKGEDDKEHRVAAYLEDDDNIFAAEQAIAPPVIGDWQNNKDEDWK